LATANTKKKSKVDANETPAARFRRVAGGKMARVLAGITALGKTVKNCDPQKQAEPKAKGYFHTPDQQTKMLTALDAALTELKAQCAGKAASKFEL
jgi:hypothetical protein